MTALAFFVEGKPQTAGSKVALPITNKATGERVGTRVLESGDRHAKQAWREDVREAARRAIREAGGEWPCADALAVEFIFHRRRPKSDYGTGKNAALVKASAPPYPIARPDALKLARAAEDALSGIVWVDDAVIVDERLRKIWDLRDGVSIVVRRLPDEGIQTTLDVVPDRGGSDGLADR